MFSSARATSETNSIRSYNGSPLFISNLCKYCSVGKSNGENPGQSVAENFAEAYAKGGGGLHPKKDNPTSSRGPRMKKLF